MKPRESGVPTLGTLFLALSVLASTGTGLEAAARGRVNIQNGNVVADNGKPLRGTAFFLDLFDIDDMRNNESTYRDYFRKVSTDYRMNCIRICPWIGNWQNDVKNDSYHNSQFTYMVDKVVDWCEEDGIYAVVNLTTQWGTAVDLNKAKGFWDVFGPRYKDRTHVVYEVINEPEVPSALSNMKALHDHVRGKAPDTHLILYSFANPTAATVSEFQSSSSGVNFNKASIGFHVYDWIAGKDLIWNYAKSIRDAGFPVVCTEFFSLTNADHMPIAYDFLMPNIDLAEGRGMSWIQWGPFAQYRNTNKGGWNHDAIKFSSTYTNKLSEYGIPVWAKDNGTGGSGGTSNLNGTYRIECLWGKKYLDNPANNPWSVVRMENNSGNNRIRWELQQVTGNIYRIKSKRGSNNYLHGDNNGEWKDTRTAPLNTDWWSQQWQLEQVSGDVYRLKMRWGGYQYLSGRNVASGQDNVRTAPLNSGWTSQQWKLIPE